MIVVRDVFQLRFGAAREAVALWQEGMDFLRRLSSAHDIRLLTDLTGNYYTLVLESSYDNLSTYENEMRSTMNDEAWRKWYARFVPLVTSGRREMFNVVGSESHVLKSASESARATARR